MKINKCHSKIGLKTGRLLIIEVSSYRGKLNKELYFTCLCDCGNKKEIASTRFSESSLSKRNIPMSCGCEQKIYLHDRGKHYETNKSLEYSCWRSMKDRCYRKSHSHYARYGGRGITVCEEWKNNFNRFLEDMGRKPSISHTIERLNNDKGYSPDNCKWVTKTEQANNRHNTVYLSYDGQKKSLMEWFRFLNLGLTRSVFTKKISRHKMSIAEIINEHRSKIM